MKDFAVVVAIISALKVSLLCHLSVARFMLKACNTFIRIICVVVINVVDHVDAYGNI